MKFIFQMRNLFILVFLCAPLAFANQFTNPYLGNIAVADHSEHELKVLALKQVLVKTSGNADIINFQETDLAVKKVDQFLSQYGYQNLFNTRYFMAVFDQFKINQVLKDMQQPIWGETRPITLIWLVTDGGNERQFVSDNLINQNSDSSLSPVFLNQQYNRGIKLQFPIMDLEDRLALSISDVSGRFYNEIAMATKRYGVDHFVAANLKQIDTETWSLSWELIKSSAKQNKILVADKIRGKKTQLESQMVNKIADYYASQYAVSENQGEKFSQTIYIDGVNSLAKLSQLNKVLTDLLAVASFEIRSVQGGQVTVDIKINGGFNSFKNGLFVQSNLQPDLSQGEDFHFNWR